MAEDGSTADEYPSDLSEAEDYVPGDEEVNYLDYTGFEEEEEDYEEPVSEENPAWEEKETQPEDTEEEEPSSGGRLSFHDPILFKVDEILGLGGEDWNYEIPGEYQEEPLLPIEVEREELLKFENQGTQYDEVEPVTEEEFEPTETLTEEELEPMETVTEEESEPTKPQFEDSVSQFLAESAQENEDASPTLGEQLSATAVELESRPITPCAPESASRSTQARMHQCPSIESFLKLGLPVQIVFNVLPGPKLFAQEARLDWTVQDIKNEIAPICQVPPEYLELRKNHNLITNHRTLVDVGGRPHRKMKLTLELSKRCPPIYTIRLPEAKTLEKKPPITRQVTLDTKEGWKRVTLTVEYDTSEERPYLGGYRDKRNGGIYYNSATQTPLEVESIAQNMDDASCQTFGESWKEVQTLQDQYQQTERRDYYLTQKYDKILHPKLYASTDFIERQKIKAAIIIQKYWRRWLAIRERAERLNALLLRVEWADNVRKGRTEVRLKIIQDEIRRQHNPTTMLDIELLYRAINEWRKKELEYIETYRWGADRKAALAQITEMELDLLLDLERARSKIKKGLTQRVIERAFRKMGDPARALNRSGNFMSWDTPSKFASRQYAKLYHSLKEPVTNLEERFGLLEVIYDHIKWFDSTMTKYLIELIGRELALTETQQLKLLTSTRNRIAHAFYRICRDPSFNPEAKRLENTPFDKMKLRKDMVQCKSCRLIFNRDQFTIIHGVTVSNRCRNCMTIYRTSIIRADLNLYRQMLDELRNDEQEAGVENSVSYLIDIYDLQFLVEQLWHAQSALSGMDNRYLLRLCRWNKDFPWTPWNCVLLTEEETVAHVKLEDMNSAYQDSFVDKVHVNHQAARIYFARLTPLSIPMDPKLMEFCEAASAAKKKKKQGAGAKNR